MPTTSLPQQLMDQQEYSTNTNKLQLMVLTKVVDSYNIQTQVFCCDLLTDIVSA